MQETPSFDVLRTDDNGVEHVVARSLSRRDADLLVARMTARGHKQFVDARPSGATAARATATATATGATEAGMAADEEAGPKAIALEGHPREPGIT